MERIIVAQRITTLILSVGTIVAYGYAIGGVGGYLFGKGRPVIAALGLLGGSLMAAAALKLWKKCLDNMAISNGMKL